MWGWLFGVTGPTWGQHWGSQAQPGDDFLGSRAQHGDHVGESRAQCGADFLGSRAQHGAEFGAPPAQVSDDEYSKLLSEGIQPVAAIDPNFASFTYTPRSLPEDDTSMVRTGWGTVPHRHHPLRGWDPPGDDPPWPPPPPPAGHELHQHLQDGPADAHQVGVGFGGSGGG